MSVELHLEDDEFDLIVAATFHSLGGISEARDSMEQKLHTIFEQLHGEHPADVISSGVSRINNYGGYVDAAVVHEVIDEYHDNDIADAPRVTFEYHGSQRVVENPEFKGHLLGGVEVRKDGVRTEQYKNYLLSEITF